MMQALRKAQSHALRYDDDVGLLLPPAPQRRPHLTQAHAVSLLVHYGAARLLCTFRARACSGGGRRRGLCSACLGGRARRSRLLGSLRVPRRRQVRVDAGDAVTLSAFLGAPLAVCGRLPPALGYRLA